MAARVLNRPIAAISVGARLATDLAMDSLGRTELALRMGRAFVRKIPDEVADEA